MMMNRAGRHAHRKPPAAPDLPAAPCAVGPPCHQPPGGACRVAKPCATCARAGHEKPGAVTSSPHRRRARGDSGRRSSAKRAGMTTAGMTTADMTTVQAAPAPGRQASRAETGNRAKSPAVVPACSLVIACPPGRHPATPVYHLAVWTAHPLSQSTDIQEPTCPPSGSRRSRPRGARHANE